ncbi:winged helix-turn-helix domain-containing protein [Tenggerimyces flavus]|uniref:Winged helix-turn-helix domain-containing protein n=1 Tax=Tenggerimyces flavus TaxID=1708749 RepID=A0ABV7Y4I6_9ACTN|nr:GntR family transcriptional regulator [Tenggerimyces flavus]MBM7788446.1 DNA-binding transcriptional regulator YhcF (GntR family) [Tenggerimyces flavus]
MAIGAEDLFDLDPDDPRTPSQQIANSLRAAILLDRLQAGDRLPSQHALCERFGVARETVKSALRILDRDGLIVSRQGSGVFVKTRREPSHDLEEFLRSAFDRPHVTIDYAGWRAETLSNVLPRALDVLRSGQASVRSFRLRLLLVDPSAPVGLPRPVDPTDSMRSVRPGLLRLHRRSLERLDKSLASLAGLVRETSMEVRLHTLGPTFKSYLLNDERVLFGFYPVAPHSMDAGGRSVELHHPSGWDMNLFGPDEPFTRQTTAWFDSVWSTIATDA